MTLSHPLSELGEEDQLSSAAAAAAACLVSPRWPDSSGPHHYYYQHQHRRHHHHQHYYRPSHHQHYSHSHCARPEKPNHRNHHHHLHHLHQHEDNIIVNEPNQPIRHHRHRRHHYYLRSSSSSMDRLRTSKLSCINYVIVNALTSLRTLLLVLVVVTSLVPICAGQATDETPRPRGPVLEVRPPTQLVFANTKGASISCTARGRPAPIMDWLRDDDQPVEDVPSLLTILPNNSLVFHPFPVNKFRPDVHKRGYRCLASNTAGSVISSQVTVRAVLVREYTNYEVTPVGKWVMRGSTAVIRCVINPLFVTTYVKVIAWYQGHKELQSDGRVSILQDGSLHIRNIQEGDTGMNAVYTCVTSNVLTGENRTSDSGFLTIHEPPAGGVRPIIDQSAYSLTTSLKHRVELPCVATDAFPTPNYSWEKDGKFLQVDGRRLIQRGGNLLVLNATVDDSGEYICTGKNSHGQDSTVTQLTVMSPLSVVVNPAQQVVDAGKTARFNCTTSGHPVVSYRWMRNGHALDIDGRRVVASGSDANLVIKDISQRDQGMYQCFVANSLDSAQGVAQLSLGAAAPVLLDGFQEQFVQTGQKVTMHCRFSGNPLPNVTWSLDGANLPSDPFLSVNSLSTGDGDVISYVNISAIQVQLGGEYTCYADSKVGHSHHTNKLNVYGTPFIKPMPNVTATASKDLALRCYVSGYPLHSIHWTRGEAQLPINHRQSVLSNGTLIIRRIQREDSGQYTCVARNREGQGMTRSMHISVVEPPMIDPFHFRQRKKGDRIRVICAINSGDLPVVIQWQKDRKPIPLDLGIQIRHSSDFSILSISRATPRHDGNYTCVVTNAAASANYTARLHIDVPPRWVTEPKDSFVILHQSVSLDCQATGTPSPTVVWKKAKGETPGNYEDLKLSPANDHSIVLPNGTLVIKKAKEEVHGFYLCHASNHVGFDISKVVHLQVHIPARFNEPRKNYTVLKGESITMECQAVGDKPLSMAWSFQGSPFSSVVNDRAEVVSQFTPRGKLSQLTLNPAIRADSGFYTCNAKNEFGNGVLVNYLLVLEPPEPPSNLKVLNVSSRSVYISWSKPYDGNSPISSYIVQYKNASEIWQGVLPNVTVQWNQQQVTLTNLLPAFTYHFRVKANNSVGYSDPSPMVEASTEEEAPTGPPIQVTVQAVGSQALKVIWKPPQIGYRNGKIQGYYIGYKETQSPAQFIYVTHQVNGSNDQKPITTPRTSALVKPRQDEEEGLEGKTEMEHSISKLKKFTQYSIHVKAYNQKGISPASENINVFTLEDVPSQPPAGVQATPLSSGSIKVAWSPPPLFTLHGILQGYKILFKPVRLDEDESDASFRTTDKLEIVLFELDKFTNYSIQVLAFTRKGEGVRSNAVYVATREDVPGAPESIKALAINSTAIMVSWQPPANPNGHLIKYTLYYNNQTGAPDVVVTLSPDVTHHILTSLTSGTQYVFRASASTAMGEGQTTRYIDASTLYLAPARIASFSRNLTVSWHQDVVLPCLSVGKPAPTIQWKRRNVAINPSDRIGMFADGSLHIQSVTGTDAATYTCVAENLHGHSQIDYTLRVQVGDIGSVPHPPHLYLILTTTSTIQVNWLSGSNGGSPIQGFRLSYKKEHNSWKSLTLGSQNRTFMANNLMCGTQYKFAIQAYNRVGDSQQSDTVVARTNGSAPVSPMQSELLKTTNATSVTLDLKAWQKQTNSCPIRFFSIRYHIWDDSKWHLVSNSIQSNMTLFVVQDLSPATWYVMDITAHSDAGSTTSQLKFGTLTYSGSTIKPLKVIHKQEAEFYERVYLMVPISAAVVFIFSIIVAIFLYCRRRRDMLRYKEQAANLRRDITAETSLMNDLDKRLNTEFDSSSSSTLPDHGAAKQHHHHHHNQQLHHQHHRHANLFVSLQSDDNSMPAHSSSSNWLIDGSEKLTTDNISSCRSDEGNINPYATYNEIKPTVIPEVDLCLPLKGAAVPKSSSEEDDIAMQKVKAKRQMLEDHHSKQPCQLNESYVPLFHSKKGHNAAYPDPKGKHPPPPLPAPRKSAGGKDPNMAAVADPASKEGYDNHGVILSPRRYASADQIHALFTHPPRPHSCMKSGSESTDKGSQRHSLISSVTTVSSSRDELMEALENAKRNPPPPILYESEHQDNGTEGDLDPDSSSQPTDSSLTTEPGIRMFTQSPPKPNEQRQASCEVPAYEQQQKRRRPQRMDNDTSDNSEVARRASQLKRPLPPRKVRPRHRGKHRGQVTGKRPLGTFMTRTQSGTSTTSTNSEEVTYTFGQRATTPRSNSPSESYPPSYTAVAESYPPSYNTACAQQLQQQQHHQHPRQGFGDFRQADDMSRQRRVGRRTPHTRVRYDTNLPTPGTDEHRPLVTSLAHPTLATSPEEEESVSLLDRHYRPVPEEEDMETTTSRPSKDKGYTEDFTIV